MDIVYVVNHGHVLILWTVANDLCWHDFLSTFRPLVLLVCRHTNENLLSPLAVLELIDVKLVLNHALFAIRVVKYAVLSGKLTSGSRFLDESDQRLKGSIEVLAFIVVGFPESERMAFH